MIYYICAVVLVLLIILYRLERYNRTRKLAEARLRSTQYFDDEDLDRFKGRSSDGYTDQEVEEFRYVMYTMQQQEVLEWMECLQAREIELPDELKEECYSMMNEV